MVKQTSDYFEGIVQDVREGKHGFYAVVTCDEIEGTITFSIGNSSKEESSAWDLDKENHKPSSGEVVLLYDVHRKRDGWRASKVTAKRP